MNRNNKMQFIYLKYFSKSNEIFFFVYFRAQLENGSLYISSVEQHRGLDGPYTCVLNVEGIGTIVSRSARVSIASKKMKSFFIELLL